MTRDHAKTSAEEEAELSRIQAAGCVETYRCHRRSDDGRKESDPEQDRTETEKKRDDLHWRNLQPGTATNLRAGGWLAMS